MSISDILFRSLFNGTEAKASTATRINLSAPLTTGNIDVGAMATAMAIHYVATVASQATYRTIYSGSEKKAKEWALLNLSPNPNQSAPEFWAEAVGRMLVCGEALIVDDGQYLRICDSWEVEKKPLGVDTYKNIHLDATAGLSPLPATEVLHLRLPAGCVPSAAGVFSTYAEFVSLAREGYVPDQRYTLNVDAMAQGDANFEERYKDIVNNKIVPFLTAHKSVLPLFSGFSLSPLTESDGSKSTSQATDAVNLINDSIKKAAALYHIPAGLLLGDVAPTPDMVSGFLSTVILPIVNGIAKELTRKRLRLDDIVTGSCILADLAGCRYIDPVAQADKIDKLIASGYYTIDEVHIRCGDIPTGDPLCQQRLITKNYNTDLEGGKTENESN